MKIVPVILSGGSGTRLWPLSRKQYPKQYLPLAGDNTMLQETVLRLNGLDNITKPIVICNVEHRFLVAEQMQQIGINSPTILLEPVGRNTAPAITVAALQARENNKETILLVLPADHIIQNIKAFHKAINIAIKQAQNEKLVTFGIVPTNANTGYGYIQTQSENDGLSATKVKSFKEKPNAELAEKYLAQNSKLSIQNLPLSWYWNSGIFMFKTDVLLNEMSEYAPKIISSVKKSVDNATQDLDFIRLSDKDFASSPSDSIDYALMEKTDNAIVVPLDANWSDVGSWDVLYNVSNKDSSGNSITGDVVTLATTNSYINASNHMVATIGVNNLIIVDTADAILVATQEKAQEVKAIVEKMQLTERDEQKHHRKVYRPWGWYDSVETGEAFQVKRLYIRPGAKLSLQKHHKRAEHWVVVKGIATVTNGKKILTLTKGQSAYITVETIHALENKENTELEIIEVQSGEYLGEDDIVRFEDIYGRVKK